MTDDDVSNKDYVLVLKKSLDKSLFAIVEALIDESGLTKEYPHERMIFMFAEHPSLQSLFPSLSNIVTQEKQDAMEIEKKENVTTPTIDKPIIQDSSDSSNSDYVMVFDELDTTDIVDMASIAVLKRNKNITRINPNTKVEDGNIRMKPQYSSDTWVHFPLNVSYKDIEDALKNTLIPRSRTWCCQTKTKFGILRVRVDPIP